MAIVLFNILFERFALYFAFYTPYLYNNSKFGVWFMSVIPLLLILL